MEPHWTDHHVLWQCAELASCEHGVLRERADSARLAGFVVLKRDDMPCHIEHQIELDHWHTRHAWAKVSTTSESSRIELRTEGAGAWTLNEVPAAHLDGCTDVDLGWSPATNTIPIRRLALDVGESATISAAWVRFPELDVVASDQRYTRLAADRWRYQSGGYDFVLRTDRATGLVLAYGDDLWHAAATSFG